MSKPGGADGTKKIKKGGGIFSAFEEIEEEERAMLERDSRAAKEKDPFADEDEEEEDEETSRRRRDGENGHLVLNKEINFRTADKKSKLKDATGEDESYWGVCRLLDSEIAGMRRRRPRTVLRELRDFGYLCVLLSAARTGGVFVARCMINRFSDKTRPKHSRLVDVVFESSAAPGASAMDDDAAMVVNYILGDADMKSGTETRLESALDTYK